MIGLERWCRVGGGSGMVGSQRLKDRFVVVVVVVAALLARPNDSFQSMASIPLSEKEKVFHSFTPMAQAMPQLHPVPDPLFSPSRRIRRATQRSNDKISRLQSSTTPLR